MKSRADGNDYYVHVNSMKAQKENIRGIRVENSKGHSSFIGAPTSCEVNDDLQ